ncbi:MAG TPA: thiamine-phosphate kinase [Candidatus Omnitrophota bacterium]|nr:thiamine-phosphate kinase [Candidatus Omnitrophota bacterium]
MKIGNPGEFGLIRRLAALAPVARAVVKGIGDDCAVLPGTKDTFLLWTCDMLVERVDFTRRDAPALVGRKALGVSVSDIAACGGIPRYALVALGLPSGIAAAYVQNLYRGMRKLAQEFGVSVVGGDISRAPAVTIDVSLLGEVRKKRLVLRSGARPGDIIFVTGRLGGSLAGRHLRFQPRVREAQQLVARYGVHAMIDISDGLSSDVGHLIRASGVGADIYAELVPAYPGVNLEHALNDGEDFELLFTVNRTDARRLSRGKTGFFPVGVITSEKNKVRLIDRRGDCCKLVARGFTHF